MPILKKAALHSSRPRFRRLALGWLMIGVFAVILTRVSAAAPAAPSVLYDAAQGSLPDAQGFTFLALPSVAPAISGGATVLDTSSSKSTVAGYFSKPTPQLVLDRAAGYTVRFTVQVDLEDHSGSDKNNDGTEDRAGFSVIVLSSDKRGIELGFWQDRIWAQEGGSGSQLFTQAERAVFNTQPARTPYMLAVHGDTYTLSSNGTAILSGKLRDYTAFNGFPDPYETPNLIFLGDDTRSASAKIQLTYVAFGPASSNGPGLERRVYLPLLMR